MVHWPIRLTPLDHFLGRFTRLRPGEGRSVVAFFCYALLMMLSYYILKTIREPLLLTGSSAEMKSYATAATAVLLLDPRRGRRNDGQAVAPALVPKKCVDGIEVVVRLDRRPGRLQ